MANGFSKEEKVAFEELLEGFQDALILSNAVSVYNTDQTSMERQNDAIWRPMPYIARSFDGIDMTSNFKDQTQLSVPARIGFQKSSPWQMTAKELRDALQEKRLGDAAKQKLASDINVAVTDVACMTGTCVVKRTSAATGFDDLAQAEALFNEIGVQMGDRYAAFGTRDYNGMASELQKASRSFGNKMSDTAYSRAKIATDVAGFDVLKLDYVKRLAAAAGGSITIDTRDSATTNFYNPVAVIASPTTGERLNKDNRFQTITVSATTNVKAGDSFTIANVEAVHLITKQSTGLLKTFRVISVDSGTTMTISPPIISNQVANDAAAQYQNCVVTAKSATAAITWLNTATAALNPFWHKDAIEVLPGRYEVPTGAGMDVIRGKTDQGFELMMTKQSSINALDTKFRVDVFFGVVNKQPEMTGLMLFNQS
jgi:hypothetical protein